LNRAISKNPCPSSLNLWDHINEKSSRHWYGNPRRIPHSGAAQIP